MLLRQPADRHRNAPAAESKDVRRNVQFGIIKTCFDKLRGGQTARLPEGALHALQSKQGGVGRNGGINVRLLSDKMHTRGTAHIINHHERTLRITPRFKIFRHGTKGNNQCRHVDKTRQPPTPVLQDAII